jgi:HSP20 family molecular chaperone IbpA
MPQTGRAVRASVDGVLTIRVPKSEKAARKKIEIKT